MFSEIERRIEAVEQGVPDAVLVRGHPSRMPLVDRMRAHNMSGVSLAIVHKGRIEWSRGYGTTSVLDGVQVKENTLFQAASISKPVAAFAAMILADQGKLDLDADVADKLSSWRLPAGPSGRAQRITARRIMSHTAGLTLGGMPGYLPGARLPNTVQILDGVPPAVNPPIGIAVEPGSEFRYSGGGYTVLELLISEVTGRPFDEFVDEAVLGPCGMLDSTFAQPLPPVLAKRAACGHAADGAAMADKWEVMPALAASGLWTTAPDLARFVMETQRALLGQSRLLSRSAARAMLASQQHGPAGLGFWLEGTGDAARFFHTGANTGYRGHVVGYLAGGHGAAVLTNGDDGATLCLALLNGIAEAYGWPRFATEKTVAEVEAAVLDRYVGEYEVAGMSVVLARDGDMLVATAPGFGSHRLYPESATQYFFADIDGSVTFEVDDAGGACVTVRMGSAQLPGFRR